MEMLPIYISPWRYSAKTRPRETPPRALSSPAAPAGLGGHWLLKGGYNSEWVLPKRGI